jgi:hypothetical protein
MKYEIKEHSIEIDPEDIPVEKILETIGNVSFRLARFEGLGSLSYHLEQEINFNPRKYINYNGKYIETTQKRDNKILNWLFGPKITSEFKPEGIKRLSMDYAEGSRCCKTSVSVMEDGTLLFGSYNFDKNGPGKSELLMKKVQRMLNGDCDLEKLAESYGIKLDSKESKVELALILDKENRLEQAIEVMTEKPFDIHGPEGVLLRTYVQNRDDPKKFYEGFA